MTDIEDRPPTTGERYSSATGSSNLKLSDRRRGDADFIIAAGLIPDGLACTLYRLQVEFDSMRDPLDEARRWAAKQHSMAAELRAQAASEGRSRAAAGLSAFDAMESAKRETKLRKEADLLSDAAVASIRTEFVIALDRLTTLAAAKRELGAFALAEAQSRRINRPADDLLRVTGRVLDAYLDPGCHHCAGRGFNGASHRGEMQTLCRPCRGSGHRRDSIGQNEAERGFASHLLMSMDALLHQAQRDIRTALNMVSAAKDKISEAGQGESVNR